MPMDFTSGKPQHFLSCIGLARSPELPKSDVDPCRWTSLKEMTLEREFLKNAAAFFASETQSQPKSSG